MEPMIEQLLLKSLAKGLFAYATPKIKNMKSVRDFKDRWFKDNYNEKTILMFKAGIADAKKILDLPDELIKGLLEDEINRREIYRWIIEGTLEHEFNAESFNLEPYYERFPHYADKLLTFFQLILLKVDEYKEKNWDPELLSIINRIDGLREEVRTGFEHLDKQATKNFKQMHDSLHTKLTDILGPVGYEDLKKLLEEGQIVTARKKAEERLRHALTNVEKLELNALIANSYLTANEVVKSIPFLQAAISFCEDSERKNRLFALINICEEKFDCALDYIEKNVSVNGYTEKDLKLLINIYLLQNEFSKCLSLIDKYGNDSTILLKAQILLYTSKFNEVISIAEDQLKKSSESKDWALIKADALCLKLEKNIAQNQPCIPDRVFEAVKPLLEIVEYNNQNERMLRRVKELYAGIYFHSNKYKEAAIYFEEIYYICDDERKEKFFTNLIWSLYLSRDWDKTINFLEKKFQETAPSEEYILILARVYMQSGKPRKGLETLNRYFVTSAENKIYSLDFYFLKIDILFRLFKQEEINEFLRELDGKENIKFMNVIKGYYATLVNDWDLAIYYLEAGKNTVSEKDLTDLKLKLIEAYKNRGEISDYKKIKEIIPTFHNWNLYNSITNAYVLALYELKEYEEALYVYFNETIEKTRLCQEIVGDIYFQSEWYDLSKEFFEDLYHKTENVSYLFRYADCLFRTGKSNDCLNTLKLAEKKVLKEGNTGNFQLLTFAYLDAMEYEKALEYAYLTFKNGEKNPNVWKFYFVQFLQISQFVTPQDEYILAYEKIAKTFHKVFPEEDVLFEEIEAIDNDKLTDEFTERIKNIQTQQKKIDEIFMQHSLPLQTIHYLNSKDPGSIWAYVANQEELHFFVNQFGSIEENVNGIVNVMTSKRVLVDLYSIFTLNYLDLLPALNKHFQIYLYQEQYTALLNEYMQLKLSIKDGKQSIHYQNENIQFEDWKSEEILEALEQKKKLLDWIYDNCKMLGKYNVNPSNDFDFLYDDRLQLCQNSSLTLLVDNFNIRNHAKSTYNIDTITSVDLLNYLFIIDSITVERLNNYIAKLIIIGYRYITAKPEVFFEILKKNQFNIVNEVEWVLGYLREKRVNREYVLTTVLGILSLMERHPISQYQKETLYYICSVLVNEEDSTLYLKKLIDEIRNMEDWNKDFSDHLIYLLNEKLI